MIFMGTAGMAIGMFMGLIMGIGKNPIVMTYKRQIELIKDQNQDLITENKYLKQQITKAQQVEDNEGISDLTENIDDETIQALLDQYKIPIPAAMAKELIKRYLK